MNIRPQKFHKEIEKTISLVVHCCEKKCLNPKPLILHSISVGSKLLEMGESREVVLAGFLHDLVEDTDCTIGKIEKLFGQEVSDIVESVTQEKIIDYKKRWEVLMNKIEKQGKSAMILKLVDMNENLRYLPFLKTKEEIKNIYWKHNFAMSRLKPYLKDLEIFDKCKKEYKKMFSELGL